MRRGFSSRDDSNISYICHQLHKFANILSRFSFPFDTTALHRNGIYLLFEKNERAHGADRIVRVGTHNGKNQLRSRLEQHFIIENKDRSIFRKNIGRAILNKRNDPFLADWEKDLTSQAARRNAKGLDIYRQKKIEREVTEYIQKNFSFTVIQAESKAKRLELESKLISTLAQCKCCKQTKKWLGNYSPKLKIRQSGLWQEQKLFGEPLSQEDMDRWLLVTRGGSSPN